MFRQDHIQQKYIEADTGTNSLNISISSSFASIIPAVNVSAEQLCRAFSNYQDQHYEGIRDKLTPGTTRDTAICANLNVEVEMKMLGTTIEAYNTLILKSDNLKVDLQSPQGIQAFRSYIQQLQQLIQFLDIKPHSRSYRSNYTKAYRVLYAQGELGYIPQIFDAAQEAFPYIWVNGQCYLFQPSTIEQGQKLVDVYFRVIEMVRLVHLQACTWVHGHTRYGRVEQCSNREKNSLSTYNVQLRALLQQFDQSWLSYQKSYIEQLIKIEQQAKKLIIQAIIAEQQLTLYEQQQKLKGKIFYQNDVEYHLLRQKFCEFIGKVNSVANINGKGRDDLGDQVLMAAENVIVRVSDSQSRAVRIVAEKIRQTFISLREVIKQFHSNIQMVDPQLKNNQCLVQSLAEYQLSWQKGKRYFLDPYKQNQILTFSSILQAARDKYPTFRQQLEFSDPCVFWMIPGIVVLRSLQGEDQGLAYQFVSEGGVSEQYMVLKSEYDRWRQQQIAQMDNNPQSRAHTQRQLYNQLQKNLIQAPTQPCNLKCKYSQMTSKIKQFAISLQRMNPTDWNDMLSVLLTDQV